MLDRVREALTLQNYIVSYKEIGGKKEKKKKENKHLLITIRMQNQEVNFSGLSLNLNQTIPRHLRNILPFS